MNKYHSNPLNLKAKTVKINPTNSTTFRSHQKSTPKNKKIAKHATYTHLAKINDQKYYLVVNCHKRQTTYPRHF